MYKNEHVSSYRYTGRLQTRDNQSSKYKYKSLMYE